MKVLGSFLIACALVGLWMLGAVGIATGFRGCGIDAVWLYVVYPAYCLAWLAVFGGPGRRHPRWFDWR